MQSANIDLVAGSNLFPHKLRVYLVISCQECKARGCGGWVSLWRSCVFSFSTGAVCQGWKVRSGGVEGELRPQAGRVLIGPWGEEKILCACRGVSLWWTWSIYDNDWRKENCHGVKISGEMPVGVSVYTACGMIQPDESFRKWIGIFDFL